MHDSIDYVTIILNFENNIIGWTPTTSEAIKIIKEFEKNQDIYGCNEESTEIILKNDKNTLLFYQIINKQVAINKITKNFPQLIFV
jgi:hypothetical protein